jgi:endonuclease/exonuclease/phosphatase family metal-dependent hydrolase
LQDVRNHNLFQKHGLTVLTAEKIRVLVEKLSGQSQYKNINSIIMGDFNMPPTHSGMTETLGFNSTGIKSKLKEKSRYQFMTYTNYYNPSFDLLTDANRQDSIILFKDIKDQDQSSGYSFKSKNGSTHLIDHVLMNKNFLGLNPLVTIFEKGLEYSDHALLMLQFEPFRFSVKD